jgi:hypothetical protein
VSLLGIGLVTFSRAQQAARGVTQETRDLKSRPENVATLEAELETLELEHEVARSELQDLLRRCNRLELLRDVGQLTPTGLTIEFVKEILGAKEAEGIQNLAGFATARASDEQNKEFEAAASEDVKRLFDSLHAFRDRKRKNFIERTKFLMQKKQELLDAKGHEREAR